MPARKGYRRKAQIYLKKGDYKSALDEIEKWLAIADEHSKIEMGGLWLTKSTVYERKCEFNTAAELQRRPLPYSKAKGTLPSC